MDISFIFENSLLDEEIVLEIKPQGPLSISSRKGEYIIFDKKLSKNMVSGMLENMLKLHIDNNEIKRKIIKKSKSADNNQPTPDHNTYQQYYPIINHLYEIKEIAYPQKFDIFTDISNNMRRRSDAGHVTGVKHVDIELDAYSKFKPIFGDKATVKPEDLLPYCPQYYTSISKREFAICDGSYYLKLKTTKSFKDIIVNNIDNNFLFLGNSESPVTLSIVTEYDNVHFEEYDTKCPYEKGTIGYLLLEEIRTWSNFELFGLADILSYLCDDVNSLYNEEFLSQQINGEVITNKINDLLEIYVNKTSYYPVNCVDDTIQYMYKSIRYPNNTKDTAVDTYFAGHIVYNNKSQYTKVVLGDFKKYFSEDKIKITQVVNPYFTKDVNPFNRDSILRGRIQALSSFIATLTPNKFYYNNCVYLPKFETIEEYFLFKKLIIDNHDNSQFLTRKKPLVSEKNKDVEIDLLKPIAKYGNYKSNYYLLSGIDNQELLLTYIKLIDINLLINNIINEASLFDNKILINALKKCNWLFIGSKQKVILNINKCFQELLISNGGEIKRMLNSFVYQSKIDRAIKRETKGERLRFTSKYLQVMTNTSLNNFERFRKDIKFFYKDNFLLKYIMDNNFKEISQTEKEKLVEYGRYINKVFFKISAEKERASHKADKNKFDYLSQYLNSVDIVIRNSSNALELFMGVNDSIKRHRITPKVDTELFMSSNDWDENQFKTAKQLLSISLYVTDTNTPNNTEEVVSLENNEEEEFVED